MHWSDNNGFSGDPIDFPSRQAPHARNQSTQHKNFSIFIHGTILFGYFEYYGKNLQADMKKWGENKKMQEWWNIHIPMLEPLEKGNRDDGWIYMDEIFHTG